MASAISPPAAPSSGGGEHTQFDSSTVLEPSIDLLGPVIYFRLGKSPSTGGLTEMKVDCPDLLGRLVD